MRNVGHVGWVLSACATVLAWAGLCRGQVREPSPPEPEAKAAQWVVQIGEDGGLTALRNLPNVATVERAPYVDDAFIVTFRDVPGLAVAASRIPQATLLQPLVARQQSLRFIPNDTLFGLQWHLNNTGQSGGTAGEDANVVNVWGTGSYNGITGSGVVVAVVDDGLQHTHPDLSANYHAVASYDYNFNDTDPAPTSSDPHGTAVAGVIGARGHNSTGVSGVAPLASLAGIRLIAAATTDLQEANALSHMPQTIDIYSNSWGPTDDGNRKEGPGALTAAAIKNNVETGRGGLGSIYIWAGGNGQSVRDNVNYDGYANSRYTIAVAAIDDNGVQASYSEPGAPLLVSAHSSGAGAGIVTTDLTGGNGYNGIAGQNNYTDDFGGTSASAPLVAGVVALMLDANPNLTYRDVQHILVDTARKNHASDSDWTTNGSGRWVNHKYGFGAVDAQAAVAAAQTWTNVGPEVSYTSPTLAVSQAIPDGLGTQVFGAAVTRTHSVTEDLFVEWVEVTFNATFSTFRGDLEIVLTSPDGTESILADLHDDSGSNYDWTFTSARHWGEQALGDWTLRVRDGYAGFGTGTWNSWSLRLYGTQVPEPGTLALLLLAALGHVRRRRAAK